MKLKKSRILNSKLGVSGYHKSLLGKVDFFEIDSFDPILKSKYFPNEIPFHLSANHFYFNSNPRTPLIDRMHSLIELCEFIKPLHCILKLPPSFFEKYTLENTIHPFIRTWTKQCSFPVLIDLPQTLPGSLKKSSHVIIDPLWHGAEKNVHWKIHGWHDSRWVRRYSKETLKSLLRDCSRLNPKSITFAHSQRVEQAMEFIEPSTY